MANCKTCKWAKKVTYDDKGGPYLYYLCRCDYEEYSEEELFDCSEHNMEVEIEPE